MSGWKSPGAMWGPQDISWFTSPSNYSYWSYKPTYILGASHCEDHWNAENPNFPQRRLGRDLGSWSFNLRWPGQRKKPGERTMKTWWNKGNMVLWWFYDGFIWFYDGFMMGLWWVYDDLWWFHMVLWWFYDGFIWFYIVLWWFYDGFMMGYDGFIWFYDGFMMVFRLVVR